MKRNLYALTLFCLVFSYSAFSQHWGKSDNKNCGENGFSSEVIKAELKENGCIDYSIEVTYEKSKCSHALSHYTVAVSCGKISNVSNSENWKLEYGYDKTTGLYGFKVDDIPNFGETDLKSFTVSFTVCQDGNKKCSTKEGCCHPIVAYKAGQCVYYDKLNDSCPATTPNPPPTEPELKASIQKIDITCSGENNGKLTVVVEEGKEPYTYKWSNGATTSSIEGLSAGLYTVVVKDANENELSLEGTISVNSPISVTNIVSNESCSNANGSIELTVTGGSGSYTYLWSNQSTSKDLASLSAGTYSVVVKDANGCTKEELFTISNQSSLTVTGPITQPGCGKSNGSIDITVSGGTEPYSYNWSNGAVTQDIQNLAPGTYRLSIVDAGGCSSETTYIVKENNTLKLTSSVAHTSCLDNGTGAIDLNVTGGTGPYTYTWSNGATTQDISGLNAGFYDVTVTDASGCTSTLRVSVVKKAFQINEQVIQPGCSSSTGGSVTLNPVNGVEPYTYEWSNGSTTNSVSGLSQGVYTVTVTDATGCSRDLAYVITDPTGITSTAAISNNNCNAEGYYSIDISVSGGQGPYQYQWSNGSNTEDISGLESGNYTVTITDASGCSTVREVQIVGSATWSCLINPQSIQAVCGSTNNVLNTSITGATSYSWTIESSDGQWAITNGAATSQITYTTGSANSSATFVLTIVKDGCTQTCEYKVTTCEDDTETTPPDDDEGGNDEGGDDDGSDGESENPDNSGTCEDCFDSEIVKVSSDGSCRTYEVKVSTDGLCRHDLSHWTIAIPCGTVKNYTNSNGWKMEIGKDPTTGLNGLKVDDINGFGGSATFFTVKFTICYNGDECKDELNNWNPVVAYKAGQCVDQDELSFDNDSYEGGGDNNGDLVCKAYPNPFRDKMCFEWKAERDEEACLELFDTQGHHIKDLYRGKVKKGENYKVECNDLQGSMYIYRFKSGNKTTHGKICKTR